MSLHRLQYEHTLPSKYLTHYKMLFSFHQWAETLIRLPITLFVKNFTCWKRLKMKFLLSNILVIQLICIKTWRRQEKWWKNKTWISSYFAWVDFLLTFGMFTWSPWIKGLWKEKFCCKHFDLTVLCCDIFPETKSCAVSYFILMHQSLPAGAHPAPCPPSGH